MNKSPKIYHKVVGVRLTETDATNLDRLCAVMGVTRSEFVRNKIQNINNLIMKKDIFNITEGPATDAWGRDVAKLQQVKESNAKQVKNQVDALINPPAEPQSQAVKKPQAKPVIKAKPATSYFAVNGFFGDLKIKFHNTVEAATTQQAGEAAKRFHKLPGRVVTVTSIRPVTAASVKGKNIIKA